MADEDDIRDAAFFRLWIRLAHQSPIRVAKSLMHCIHPIDYRLALSKLADEERINLPPSTEQIELKWLSRQQLPVWGGHLERGEPLSSPDMQRWVRDEIIEAVETPRKGYVLTAKGRKFIAADPAL